MSKFLSQPLVHFLLIGALLFGLYTWVSPDEPPAQILIGESEVNAWADKWELQWGRPPTSSEIAVLTEQFIESEILYREALEMGLDHHDEVVRRRLAQKMKFVVEDLVELTPPTEQELRQYFKEKADQYRLPDRYAFSHKYFSPDLRTDPWEDALEQQQQEIPQGDLGMFPKAWTRLTTQQMDRELGVNFREEMEQLSPSDQWQGPIRSGFGVHLIKLDQVIPGKLPNWEDVQASVHADFQRAQRLRFNEALIQTIRSKYEVVYDFPILTDSLAVSP
ncbi:peptidylprolyl isomerase [Pontibacter sp. G13]|uniref:peptidylprolyl isomerase n=1 Tax=Pontibacter sp. G13 TaxID=3074898 RepID=UPI00288A26B3|nr:peptidylprolyl isomerase [Pontibacter sp. G13]WNJ18428.1 peptidylprolyl isomerase [Pontibacter sp. G13]